MHKNHKILELSDVESIKKENISIESAKKQNEDALKKLIELNNKIENEINTINIKFEKTIDDLVKSFKKKHEDLLEKENNLKEKLQNEVTKVKEKLENFLFKSNNEIKINEIINKGSKKFKNEENNINKTLSYVSKVNKNQKAINELLKVHLKSLKFNYQEEQSNINYEEFGFNGIAIPEDIKFENVTMNSLNISWKIDNINNIDIDNNKIKYRIDMKNEEGKFVQVYEGSNLNYSLDNLNFDTIYELRLCSFFNDIMSSWTDIYKIKTLDFDSIILKEEKKKNYFYKKMLDWSGYKKFELIYRGSRDGMTIKKFHELCDNKGPTITLYKNDKNIFGGYTPLSWTSDNVWNKSQECFIFTLVNVYNIEPKKFPFRNIDRYSILCQYNYGPTFGDGDIYLNKEDFLNCESTSDFPISYEDVLKKGKSIFTGDINNNKFKIKEIEVFKMVK